jgi:hypothetical protein
MLAPLQAAATPRELNVPDVEIFQNRAILAPFLFREEEVEAIAIEEFEIQTLDLDLGNTEPDVRQKSGR